MAYCTVRGCRIGEGRPKVILPIVEQTETAILQKPKAAANVIAHNLLKKFKSLSAVLDAPLEELLTVDGVGENTAVFLKLLPQLFAAYRCDKNKDEKIINGTAAAGEYFVPLFIGKKSEEVYMLSLDDKHKIIRCTKLFEGSVNAAPITVKKVVAEAVNTNATTVIIAHNHPGGIALPSSNDKVVTHKLFVALDLINIKLEDHIIVENFFCPNNIRLHCRSYHKVRMRGFFGPCGGTAVGVSGWR